MKKTFSIISLGCPRNLVDSEWILSEFNEKGYGFKEDPISASTVIINTCAFIEEAKRESIDTILKVIDAKKEGKVKHIIVAGCLPERYEKELRDELKEVDEFRGVLDLRAGSQRDRVIKLTPGHYAYIKISEGCRNRCTYCTIPQLKGPHKSRTIESIIKEASLLIQKGAKEIILVGQDTSLYGIDLYGEKKLGVLLKRFSRISDEVWVRVLYSHPANLDKEVIEIIRDNKNICRYIDLPIEHISDRLLRDMNRRTGSKKIRSMIDYIRQRIPGVAIRSSVIVGFPGERESDFQELLSFIKEVRFERLGLFRYSREEGTAAYRLKDQVSEKEKQRRFDAVMALQQEISRTINEQFKERVLKVLVEEEKEDCYLARSEYDAPEVDGLVYVKAKTLEPGKFYNVRITDTYEYDLVGELVDTT